MLSALPVCLALWVLGAFAVPATPSDIIQPVTLNPQLPYPLPTVVPEQQPSQQAPPRAAFGGTLTCHSDVVTSNDPNFYMNRDEAVKVIQRFCVLINPGTVFRQHGGEEFQSGRADGMYFQYPIATSIEWQPGDRQDCPTLDFGTNGSAVCQEVLTRCVDECNAQDDSRQFSKVKSARGLANMQGRRCIRRRLFAMDHTAMEKLELNGGRNPMSDISSGVGLVGL